MSSDVDEATQLAANVATLAEQLNVNVAVAESVTAGLIATRLAAAPHASLWFRGGVVAYSPHAKFKLLGVTEGPLVSPGCAEAMSRGVADLLDADVAVAVTGVGGPDPVEGQPPGTVWFGVTWRGRDRSETRHFDGAVEDVLKAAAGYALRLLHEQLLVEADGA
jgi:nicotinamide-nucleotide amidase